MSHSVDIQRYCKDGEWRSLQLTIFLHDVEVFQYWADKFSSRTESAAINKIIQMIRNVSDIIPNLEDAVREKFNELQTTNHDGNIHKDMVEVLPITSEQVSQLTHLSCRGHCKTNSMPVTRHNNEAYGVPQYDLKYRLKHLDENSKQVFQPKYLFCLPEVLQRYLR